MPLRYVDEMSDRIHAPVDFTPVKKCPILSIELGAARSRYGGSDKEKFPVYAPIYPDIQLQPVTSRTGLP
jgi:hypothetical protein